MTCWAGCDFSTFFVDIVLIPEEDTAEHHRFTLEGFDAFERTRDVRDKVPSRGWWEDAGVIALGIEEPMGRGSVVQKLNVVQGAILSCLPRELLVNPMRPSVWRTSVGLPGNASKDAVALFACDAMGAWDYHGDQRMPHPEMYPQDAYDACCLALAVRRLTVPVP